MIFNPAPVSQYLLQNVFSDGVPLDPGSLSVARIEDVNTTVTIGGAVTNQLMAETSSLSPFSNVVVTDLNRGQTDTATVTLSAAANGTLSNLGGGSYDAATGVYTVTAAVDAVMFTATAGQVAPGQTVSTTFAIADTDTVAANASDSSTSVVAIGVQPADEYPGGGRTIDFPDVSGDVASLSSTQNDWDTVNGSNGTIVLTDAQSSVIGGGDAIYFLGVSGDAASLYGTGSDWDIVNGSDGAVHLNSAHAKAIGGDDVISFSGGSGNVAKLFDTNRHMDKVFGSGGKVKLVDSQSKVIGNDDVIRLLGGSGGDVVKLVAEGAGSDSVHGSNAKLVLIGADASVTGGDDTVRLRGNNLVTQNGVSDTFVLQTTIGLNTINGFDATDAMRFSASDFADWTALSGHISQSGANTVIALDASDSVTLAGVTAANLSESQFQFV